MDGLPCIHVLLSGIKAVQKSGKGELECREDKYAEWLQYFELEK